MRGAWAFDIVAVLLLLAAPMTLAYGWHHWWYTVRKRKLDWHDWISFVCLSAMLATAIVGLGLWTYCEVRYNGAEQRRTGEFGQFFIVWKVWTRPLVRILEGVTIASLFGTRRLIPVMFIGSIGGIFWWILPLWMQ